MIRISSDICKDYPFFSDELFEIKDKLFYGAGFINPIVLGRAAEILNTLQKISASSSNNM